MKEEQGATTTTADAFCANIAAPRHHAVPVPVAAAAPALPSIVWGNPWAPDMKVISKSSPIQAHEPAKVELAASAALPALAAVAAPSASGTEEVAKTKSD